MIALRALALEAAIFGGGLRFIAGGFRRPRPAGYSYDRSVPDLILLLALPVMLLPEMIAFDFALLRLPLLRTISDVLHLYLIVWGYGVAGSLRNAPHDVHDGVVRLRLGRFLRVDVPRNAIASVRQRGAFATRAERRQARRHAAVAALPGNALVEIELRYPVPTHPALGRERLVTRVFAGADDARAFARELAPA